MCVNVLKSFPPFPLQEMIENTWKWARENNRIIRHPISGGEFVDIDVEHLKKVTNETGSRMTQSTGATYEAGSLNGLLVIKFVT